MSKIRDRWLERLRCVSIWLDGIFKGKPGYVIEGVATNSCARKYCISMVFIILYCLVFGNRICALVSSNASMGFDLKNVYRGR